MKHVQEKAALISVKIVDLIRDALHQTITAVDTSIHVGGAFSALYPLSVLYYGGLMEYYVANPGSLKQDQFVLSKGHAVAALASVFADVGYIAREHLENTRGVGAVVKGHPGPIIPGVPVATGPLGHGISISNGFAFDHRARQDNKNVFCLVGDGELQEGSCWEGILYAAEACLSNLVLIIDKNDGQSDITSQLIYPHDYMANAFRGFGFEVRESRGSDLADMLEKLEQLVDSDVQKPKVLICQTSKGMGGFNVFTRNHKFTPSDEMILSEDELQQNERKKRIDALNQFDPAILSELAAEMGMSLVVENGIITDCERVFREPSWQTPPARDKSLKYDPDAVIRFEEGKLYAAKDVLGSFAEAFALDKGYYTIDADLSNASGLFDGTCKVSAGQGLNVGIAECNMMCMAEALAVNGHHVQISTFAPFFDWRALRRIAVGYQERAEVIEQGDNWLSEGCNVDITMVATAANLDTSVNGATHMANDDSLTFSNVANLKIIDVSCPQLLKSILMWTAEGNKGLVYIRTMRNKEKVLYAPDFMFEYGRGYFLRGGETAKVAIISSGHGVDEALKACDLLAEKGVDAAVVDMPSFDPDLIFRLSEQGADIVFAEQNNGYLFESYLKHAGLHQWAVDTARLHHLNARTAENDLQFIHSGTYDQLLEQLGITGRHIAAYITENIGQ